MKEWILHWITVVYNNVCTWTHIFSCMRAQRCTTHIKRMETRGKEIDLLCRQREQCMRRQCVCWLAGPESDEAPDSLCLTADTACTHLTPLSWESSASPRQVFRTRPTWLWLITVTRLPLLVSSVTLCFMTGAGRSQRVQCVLASWQIFPGNIASAHRLCLTFSTNTTQCNYCVAWYSSANTPVEFDSWVQPHALNITECPLFHLW